MVTFSNCFITFGTRVKVAHMRISCTLAVAFLFAAIPSAHADKRTDAAYDALRKQGMQRQQTRDFEGALKAFTAATQLKNAPNVWLNIVSVRADQAKQLNDATSYCPETRAALSRFFDACKACDTGPIKGCSACRMLKTERKETTLAVRTNQLAQALSKRGEALKASVAALPEDEQTALQYRSAGLVAKSQELKRCVRHVQLDSQPPGALVESSSVELGTTPVKTAMFVGQHTLTFSKKGHQSVTRALKLPQNAKAAISVDLIPLQTGSSTDAQANTSTMRLVGWVGIGLGVASFATSATFFSVALDKRDKGESNQWAIRARG